jgi:hypothetical protein
MLGKMQNILGKCDLQVVSIIYNTNKKPKKSGVNDKRAGGPVNKYRFP